MATRLKEILSSARTYQKSVITKKKQSSSWSRVLITLQLYILLQWWQILCIRDNGGGGGSEFEIWTFNCTNTRKSAKLTSVNQMEESYIGIRLRCFYCQIVSFVNHPGHSYCSLLTQHMHIYSLVIGPIFRLYVSFLSLKICDYCLLMFLIVHVYDVSFNVLHYMSPT